MKYAFKNTALLLMLFTGVLVNAQNTRGINLDYLDTSSKPGQDFFRFVNGKWLDNNAIPDDRTRWGSFDELREKTDKDVQAILDKAIKSDKYANGTDQNKAIDIYLSVIDSTARNKNGIKPLKPILAKINAIKNVEELQKYLIEMEPYGGGGFFGFRVSPDLKNSNLNVGYLGSGALGLPNRDYYVDEDADTKEKRVKYVEHIAKMFQYVDKNDKNATTTAAEILAFETKMAIPRMTKEERRDARKRYNPTAIRDLSKLTPSINWYFYLGGIGVKKVDTIIVSEPKYFIALEELLKTTPIDQWKNYLKWTAINRYANRLTMDMERLSWSFNEKTLSGSKKQRPLNDRALQVVNRTVGEALGKLYVDEKFPPAAKEKAAKMVQNLKLAYLNRIKNLSWMTEETKEKAYEKVNKMTVKIGYPDKWRDYSTMITKSPKEGGTFASNMLEVAKWNYYDNLKDLGKPVDKSRWGMTPQTVNAYFSPTFNEIVFPAAILQAPFYDYQADEAVNYGGIGAVIGHEISHGFDDSGARFDADGNLKNWWKPSDLENFTALGKKLVAQYDALEALPGVFVNGTFTLGENIGDLGGVYAAFDALKLEFKESGYPNKIDGFTPEQRFFMSWATVWRSKAREEATRNLIKTDPHSPGNFRAYVPLLNLEEFYKAFDIKEGDLLYLKPSDRVLIW
ncbi:MAG: M13 family metallopeptidase [Flavobacteriaceae bacterium]|jgi:putative endopeptidase|nr:M13 family metallopeptidase [Flavobacteriaceae bacterium]